MLKPSNFHAHLRTGPLMEATAAATMRPWKYLLAMPNTGPITTIEEMLAYRQELTRVRDKHHLKTEFIMSLYLTSALTPAVVEKMAKLDFPCAVKYYPPHKGATTGSGHGVSLKEASEALLAMSECGVRLLGHFESVHDRNGEELPQESREDYFMAHEFLWLRDTFPELWITIEHATTKSAIDNVKEEPSGKTICSITPQAMLLVREDLNSLSWGNHAKCMPIAKTPEDRQAVLEFAISGDFRAHLGDDTAPHSSAAKLKPFPEAASGCYLPHSLVLYANLFHEHGKIQNLHKFACFNGPDAWKLPRPTEAEKIFLVEDDEFAGMPRPFPILGTNDVVIPFGYSVDGDGLKPRLKIETV